MRETRLTYACVAAFFAVGTVVGVATALAAIDRGMPLAGAVLTGAYLGGFASVATLFIAVHLADRLRRK